MTRDALSRGTVMRIVDLFCGIGGVAEAIRAERLDSAVIAAIDIDQSAIATYTANHAITPRCETLESIRDVPEADLWWLSPPCQPYTSRGLHLGERDRRSDSLDHLIELIERDRPRLLALENVPAFAGSPHHQRLAGTLTEAGYSVRADVLCPTQWGVPMRRRRFYLRARRDARQIPDLSPRMQSRSLHEYLDESSWSDVTLRLSEQNHNRYRSAINIVDDGDAAATAACFTSAYGKSPVRAGSYVRCIRRGIIRRFSPGEITQLMGFRGGFVWPDELPLRARYRLIGNSLSVTVVRALIESLQH